MKLSRTYLSKLDPEKIYRNIRRNMSPEPNFSGNDFTHFQELNNAIATSKSLWYNIPYEHKIFIRSNSLFYWPKATVILNPKASGTKVTIHFVGAQIVWFTIGLIAACLFGIVLYSGFNNQSQLLPSILVFTVFNALLYGLTRIFKILQTNLIGQLEYSK